MNVKPIKKSRSFFRKMLDPTDKENSSKRFVTLIVAFHFIIASFFMLFLIGWIVFTETKTNLELYKAASDTLEKVLDYDFWIITVGLGFITAEQAMKIFIEKFKALGNNNEGGWGRNENWKYNEEDNNPQNLKKDDGGELIG